jgi:hypothetical protein
MEYFAVLSQMLLKNALFVFNGVGAGDVKASRYELV